MDRSMLFKTQGASKETDPIAAREKFAVNLRKERKKKILHESRKRTLGYLKNEIAPIKSVINIEMVDSKGADSKQKSGRSSMPFNSTKQLTKSIDSFQVLIPDYSNSTEDLLALLHDIRQTKP